MEAPLTSNVSLRVRRWLLQPVPVPATCLPAALNAPIDVFRVVQHVESSLTDISPLKESEEDAWDAGALLGEGPDADDLADESIKAALAIKIASAAMSERVRTDAAVREAVQATLGGVQDVAYGSNEQVPALALTHMWDVCMANGSWGNRDASSLSSASASLGVFLVCATFLERALGDILYSATRVSMLSFPSISTEESASLAVPAILRDLLHSSLLITLLGASRVRILRLFLAAPAALNARNVCWHGFIVGHEWPTHYTLFALLLLASLDPLVRLLNLTHLMPPARMNALLVPVPFVKRHKVNLSAYESCFPFDVLLSDAWLDLACASPVLPQGRAPMLRWAVLHSNNPVLKAVLILPILEQLLRQIYVTRNDLPREMLCAQSRVYYSTLEMMMEELVPLTGKPNLLRDALGHPTFALLLDIFLYPEGPRLRGRLSHGDAVLGSVTSSQVRELEVLISGLCVATSASAAYLRTYTSRYHPKAMLRSEVHTLCRLLTARLQASLNVLHHDALALVTDATSASATPSLPEHYGECLRHPSTLLPLLIQACVQLPSMEALSVAQTYGTPATVLARVVCVRKLVAKSQALVEVLCERMEELISRSKVIEPVPTKRLLQAFDRLVALLPRLLGQLAHLMAFIARASEVLYRDSINMDISMDVKLLQRITVCVEKCVAPVSEHAWHKAEMQLQSLVDLTTTPALQ